MDTNNPITGNHATRTRRQFLKVAGVSAATLAAFGTAGTASAGLTKMDQGGYTAPDDYPIISTREHFDGDANLRSGYSPTEYEIEGDWAEYEAPSDEILVFVHGWIHDEVRARNAAYTCDLSLQRNQYDEFTVGFSWDADHGDNPFDWLERIKIAIAEDDYEKAKELFENMNFAWDASVEIAKQNGKKLAEWITDHVDDGGGTVRLVAHSLGAQVTASTLAELHDRGRKDVIDSVTLLGGAIAEDVVELDEPYGPGIEDATKQFHNFHKYNDHMLGLGFTAQELDDAVGEVGIDNPWDGPSNYTDVNVTLSVPDHESYFEPDDGCISQVVKTF